MIRRLVAAYVAVCIGYFSCITPARAFAPIAVLAAPQVVSAGASYGVAALAGLIGLAGLYLEISDLDGNKARVPLKEGADAEPPAPSAAPSAPPLSSGAQPDTYASCGRAYAGDTGYGWTELCSVCISGWMTWGGDRICIRTSDGFQYTQANTGVTCPPGYSSSGSSCVLSNPRQATPDKNCDLKFSASKYMYYNDADCPSGPTIDHSKAVPGLRSDGDVAFVAGKDSQGNPVLAKVLNQRDPQTGAVTQRVLQYFRQSGANVETTTVTMNPQAVVQSVSTSTSPGQLTSPSTSPSASTTPDNATTTPQAQTDPTKQPILQFPDDYAREPTTQAIKSGVEQLHRDLTDTTTLDDPAIPGSQEFTDSFFKDAFTGLKGWQLPAHSSQCPTGALDLFGEHLVIDAHCTLISNHWSALQAAMAVVWTLMALFIVLRA